MIVFLRHQNDRRAWPAFADFLACQQSQGPNIAIYPLAVPILVAVPPNWLIEWSIGLISYLSVCPGTVEIPEAIFEVDQLEVPSPSSAPSHHFISWLSWQVSSPPRNNLVGEAHKELEKKPNMGSSRFALPNPNNNVCQTRMITGCTHSCYSHSHSYVPRVHFRHSWPRFSRFL